MPVLGDRGACGQPNPLVALHVLDEARQCADAAGPADEPAVQADAHHARLPRGALAVQPVESIPAVAEELLPGAEIAAALQAAVVVVEAVGNDEVLPAGDLGPVGEIIVVGV